MGPIVLLKADPRPTVHVPVRTCVGCREKGDRSVLVRVALSNGRLTVDDAQALPGRGAWLHPTGQCLAQAVKRKAIGRALRVPEADASALVDHPLFSA